MNFDIIITVCILVGKYSIITQLQVYLQEAHIEINKFTFRKHMLLRVVFIFGSVQMAKGAAILSSNRPTSPLEVENFEVVVVLTPLPFEKSTKCSWPNSLIDVHNFSTDTVVSLLHSFKYMQPGICYVGRSSKCPYLIV